MMITYQYRIKPNSEQIAIMDNWLELLRRHWNYALGQRLDWLHRTRCRIDRCSIISEPIGKIPETANYYTQQSALKETKKIFPEYKDIYSEVQQINIQRLEKAWWRWLTPDKTLKRAGRPRFKKKGELRSFCFSRVNHPKAACFLTGTTLRIPRIGEIPVIVHRPILNGFTLKTATIVKKADGWYVCLSIEDGSVPTLMPIDTIKTAVGIDVGLEKFLATSDGKIVRIQQTRRKAQNHLGRQQRKLANQQKGSANYQKQANKVAKIHQRIQRQRKDFHYKTAHFLVRQYDLIAVEDLNIKGLARTHWGKSILDAAWGSFMTILEAVAVIRGVRVVKVNPNNTSQDCSGCGVKVKKDLSIRWHSCPHCHTELDRDINAAINILHRAIEDFKAVGLIVSACGGLEITQPLKQEAKEMLAGFQLE
ncbi:MAG: transposase [Microcoleus sp. PH2017_29_MFU_D_A]|uniref:RNA-guided endonuclease InsQ/TnpB family protein n=2 Tax=unclassified Microcoleus TaxID=2642155 RepID=UPI001D2194E2|nr:MULTISPECIES: transposase [unclassified Microcoleus]MCC3444970.1 transposase [Microcoleus sp. PH2017_03_ELD_O_A]MCC3465088.1 transposase [Microcoleus sp. PH2017_06_SFM_O_A]MCC3504050.1 transposase [Microcoleus sp. PH2017_19_SFW_U_A]TAE13526.1 MAG: transposase [Oscillatoriales cyanobacterium]MCC3411735.1 transposase [Microcoleus sp. PH2017_02_FOX_O_A]